MWTWMCVCIGIPGARAAALVTATALALALALALSLSLLATAMAGVAGANGDAGAPDDPRRASPAGHALRAPELQLFEGELQLRLNTGWLVTRAGRDEPPAPERAVDGELDLPNRRGRVRLGGGDERRLRLRVEWDFRVDDDMARVHSRIDMALFGRALTLSPPDVRVRPRFDRGEPGVEVNVPLLEGHF